MCATPLKKFRQAPGAEVERRFSLVGCTVTPGFDFADFEMATRADLVGVFPEHEEIINKFTRL